MSLCITYPKPMPIYYKLWTNFSKISDNDNTMIFYQENTSEDVICKMVDIVWRPQYVNTLRPGQNGRHVADDISNAFSCMIIGLTWLKFHWSLFPRVQLLINQHWFRQWLGTCSVPSHYLNQWWLVYWCICPQWVKHRVYTTSRWKRMLYNSWGASPNGSIYT